MFNVVISKSTHMRKIHKNSIRIVESQLATSIISPDPLKLSISH